MTLPEAALQCPKCQWRLSVEPETGERECDGCGLILPPYPLTWEGKGQRGTAGAAPPEVRLVALSLWERVGLTKAARALGVAEGTMSGWREKGGVGLPSTVAKVLGRMMAEGADGEVRIRVRDGRVVEVVDVSVVQRSMGTPPR